MNRYLSIVAAGTHVFLANPALSQVTTPDFQDMQNGIGFANASSGIVTVVGAGAANANSGKVYVYDWDLKALTAEFVASDAVPFGRYGDSVAIDGNTALVGAPGLPTSELIGSAYVIDLAAGQETFKLVASDGVVDGFFGRSVAVAGSIAAVGAPGDNNGTGAVYLFDTTTGLQLDKIVAPAGLSDDEFGFSVDFDGSFIAVGAPNYDDVVNGMGMPSVTPDVGAVFVYDASALTLLHEIKAPVIATGAMFGRSVAIEGERLVVGEPARNAPAGAAYLFDTSSGDLIQELFPEVPSMNPNFGFAVDITEASVMVSLRDFIGQNVPTAYIYDAQEGLYDTSIFFNTPASVGGSLTEQYAVLSGNEAVEYYAPAAGDIIVEPEPLIVDDGELAELSVRIGFPSAVDLQWFRDGVALTDNDSISGSQSATLQVIGGEGDTGLYSCQVLNGDLSGEVTLAVRSDPDPCVVDLNNDGELDFFDVSAFLTQFGIGCP